MVAEPWILKMGNQVSANLKHALLLESSKKRRNLKKPEVKQVIGILSFEVADIMSKTVHLHKSLCDGEIVKLQNEILKSEGVRRLISSDESRILELVLAEKLDDLSRVAGVVSRLGKKCSEPALQGFEHVYGDIMNGVIEVKDLGFLVKDMDGMVRKMERYVSTTTNLFNEMEVLNELEQATKKFQNNQHEESRRAFEQKLIWQKQDVRHLKDVSLWNQTYDKVVELLARTVCTIYARLCAVFGESALRGDVSGFVRGNSSPVMNNRTYGSGQIGDFGTRRGEVELFHAEDFNFPCVTSPGRIFMDCLSLSSSVSRIDDDDDDTLDHDEQSSQISGCGSIFSGSIKKEQLTYSGCAGQSHFSVSSISSQRLSKSAVIGNPQFGPKSRLALFASPSTVGGSALALHYANLIIVLEKLLRYPHLVGEEARDDLYQMLPTSLRMSMKTNLKSYVKNLAIYDAPLAHDWKERLDDILRWLAPLAHNMIRWQSERNFEQHQIVTRTNVLLLQTLYFADREKAEAVICELLVGLNYICRYELQQNALLDCASSFDFEDCLEWQMQRSFSYLS
ncbi:uncharacterized protein LOC104414555 [Eucalyptus grandis]|uniref:uncharacterized protein LOC104414555 n=1 Tax=Eucalyptus grandis TaxID=71139 RepID=UPI00192ECFDB|nr:uncharacterized protein LOC104414555 [Eucalyptus grandis]